jgi:pilus assembly protein CpaC
MLTCLGPVALTLAQPPDRLPIDPGLPAVVEEPGAVPFCPPANAGMPERLPQASDRPARPATGPGSVKEFLDGLTQNDAGFEVLVGQGRILTTRVDLAVKGKAPALVAIGDPTVADFAVISTRQIRIEGRRIGVTDLSIVTPDNEVYSFEVRVVADLHILRGQLHCLFPGTSLRLTQLRDHVVVEGEARDVAQAARIIDTVQAYLVSVQTGQARQVSSQQQQRQPGAPAPKGDAPPPADPDQPGAATPEQSPVRQAQGTIAPPRVINLIRVPGSKQVLLKVRVAELNRTAFRQIGADLLATPGPSTFGTRLGGGSVNVNATRADRVLTGFAQTIAGASTTAFGIFESADFSFLLSALRRNNMLRILAEPNLVALNGHAANFLAGGEFPVPVPQTGGGGIAPTITVQFKEFGVRLGFLPTILEGETIRLAVDPEVSTIDPTLGTVLVPGGSPVPGLNTRRAHTVVEMREGTDAGHRRVAPGHPRRLDAADPRAGRSADPRPVLQQHHQPAAGEGADRPGHPVSDRSDQLRPARAAARRRGADPRRRGVLPAQPDRGPPPGLAVHDRVRQATARDPHPAEAGRHARQRPARVLRLTVPTTRTRGPAVGPPGDKTPCPAFAGNTLWPRRSC